jgi:hypothetical protein
MWQTLFGGIFRIACINAFSISLDNCEATSRVPRLGEFLTIWRLLLWANLLKTTEVAKNFRLLFPMMMVMNFFTQKWASFWAIFSQPHPVTLLPCSVRVSSGKPKHV